MAGPFKMKGSPMQRNFGIGSPLNKTYSEAYGGNLTYHGGGGKTTNQLSGSVYTGTEKEMEAAFTKEAKAWNMKTYGTHNPTSDYKKAGLSSKKELAAQFKASKVEKTTPVAVSDVKRRNADIKSGKAKKIVSPVTGEDAVDYRKPEPETRKRTKVGTVGAKLRNTVSKNKVNPYRVAKKDHNTVDRSKSDADKLEGTIKYRNAQGKVVTKVKSKKTGESGGRNVYFKTTDRDDRGRKTSTVTRKLTKDGNYQTTTRNKKGTLLGRILKGTNKKVVTKK
tara:strand:+ start:641 stop:1477 length:837 start_codon:yes stop_codon:yes gene_type:complete